MDKENVVEIRWYFIKSYRKRNESGNHHVKQNRPDPERQILHVFSQMRDVGLKQNQHDCRRGTI
jgi:hypothetical protein